MREERSNLQRNLASMNCDVMKLRAYITKRMREERGLTYSENTGHERDRKTALEIQKKSSIFPMILKVTHAGQAHELLPYLFMNMKKNKNMFDPYTEEYSDQLRASSTSKPHMALNQSRHVIGQMTRSSARESQAAVVNVACSGVFVPLTTICPC